MITNEILARVCEIRDIKKALSGEESGLKEHILENIGADGSFSTRDYTAQVETTFADRLEGYEKLARVLGREFLEQNGLIKRVETTRLVVKAKKPELVNV